MRSVDIGGVLVSRGAAMALGVGIVLCLLVFGKNFFTRKMSLYNTKSDPLFNIAALKELNAFIERGLLIRYRTGKQVVYAKETES